MNTSVTQILEEGIETDDVVIRPIAPENPLSDSEAKAYWEELSCNKDGVDWGHWLGLPVLETSEAAHLLNGVDLDEERQRPEAEKKREAITKLIRLATRKPPSDRSPHGWHQWALQNGVEPFLNYTKNLSEQEADKRSKSENARVLEMNRWLWGTWQNEQRPEGADFFRRLENYAGADGSPIKTWRAAGKTAGIDWETSGGATGSWSMKFVQNKVSSFKKSASLKTCQ